VPLVAQVHAARRRDFARTPLLDAPAARHMAGINGIVRPPSASMPRPAEFDIFDLAYDFGTRNYSLYLAACAL